MTDILWYPSSLHLYIWQTFFDIPHHSTSIYDRHSLISPITPPQFDPRSVFLSPGASSRKESWLFHNGGRRTTNISQPIQSTLVLQNENAITQSHPEDPEEINKRIQDNKCRRAPAKCAALSAITNLNHSQFPTLHCQSANTSAALDDIQWIAPSINFYFCL